MRIMWVFGYGSLVWKVDFAYEQKLIGYIEGFVRRFYQHSIDHRGIPEQPGRVVTLLETRDTNSQVWGIAYKINPGDEDAVTKHLDYREKNGYSKKVVTFHPANSEMEPFQLTLYVATEDNKSYAGHASIEEIAKQVVKCKGPSGTNKEYVYNLATAMREIAPNIEDKHLYELEAAVKRLDADQCSR